MRDESEPDRGATAIGVVAILLWASLALLTTLAGDVPPFELLALSFGVAFGLGFVVLASRGAAALAEMRQPPGPWLFAFAGLFLYHALYFCALAWAPPAHASLLAYLWPLLIVVLSGAGFGAQRRDWLACVAGALLGLAGTAAIVSGREGDALYPHWLAGYAAALGCAFVWSSYSVFNRRFSCVPSGMLVGVCGAVAVAGSIVHILVESWVTPSFSEWLAIIGLGAGPTGLAFLAWDHATKRGHIAYLGLLSYLAPLVSTILLVVAGKADATSTLILAAALIIVGALLPQMVAISSRRLHGKDRT
jgi:drug/metabolite transporter (DMT)-like permease